MWRYPYCKALGGITWLTVMSHPDLTYAASQLGQYSANPSKTHWKVLMCILKYLWGTHNLALTLGRVSDADSDPDVITGHTDTSWACDADNHHSTSSYIFQLSDAFISWNSKKQSNIAMSSSEVEYVALAYSTKQALWLCYLMHNISMFNSGDPPTTELFSDNTAAITIAREACFHGWS